MLKRDCDDIGKKKSLDELKSYVLFQLLSTKLCKQIYIFCSDDQNARNGIICIGNARCLSVLSAFMKLDKEGILGREDAQPYIQAYLNECRKHNQASFKTYDLPKHMRLCKVACEQVFDEMYSNKLELLLNGNLRYKQQNRHHDGFFKIHIIEMEQVSV